MKPPTPAAPSGKGEEPPMFLQRPSVAKSQDVRHILAKTFRDLYTRDTIGPDTVKNLSVSKGGDDPYHERYVESLQKIFDERQRRLDEAAKLERHIMQAQARAMSADERELNRMARSCDNYHDLGLPPGRSHFRACIDSNMLTKHKLLTPEDYATEEPATVPPPAAPKIPSYARETVSSQQRIQSDGRRDVRDQSPLLMPHHSKSDIGGIEGPSFISEEGREAETPSPILEMVPEAQPEWKLHLNETQREIDRTDLANLQAKVNFKRNPRHVPPSAPPGGRTLVKAYRPRPKEVGIEYKRDSEVKSEPSVVFLVSPPAVVFKDYKVGQIYEITLELKNVSAVLRQCRVFPPSSQYFSVGLGQFPGEHGLVAPGMSCHYAIRFAPDSLKDFEDEIRIQTQSSEAIIVPLRGCREPPKLSLPSEIDVGYSLVGGCHVTQLLIRNEGGAGRFCVIPRASWPATNFKSVVVNGSVSLPPFEVRPSVLELAKGQTGIMEVAFSPQSVKSYSHEMTIVCDNCHVKHFTLKGESQKAGVELVTVEKGTGEIMPGELSDSTAEHLIRFDDLNPFTYTDRGVTIKNTTNVSLPFQWMIYKPDMADSDDLDRKNERVPDVDSVYSVHPTTGSLPPNDDMEFRVTFAPPVVNEFHSVLHLLLQQIPPYDEEGSAKSNKGGKNNKQGAVLSENTEEEDEETMSEIFLNNDIKQFRDVTAMEIEVKGKSIPLNVVLHPYAIYVPGQNLLGTTIKKLITMANHSRSTITFQWQPFHEKYILEVEPPFGELDPGMAMDLELSITGPEPGKIDHTLFCYVMNLDEPLHLHVEAEFKGPEVTIDAPDLNFGLVRLGQSIKRELSINNMSQMTTRWSIRNMTDYLDDPMSEKEFTFVPEEGELKPLQTGTIQVVFTPTTNKSINSIFELQVEEGNKSTITVLAEVQSPTVCLSSCEICMEEVYKGVPVKYQAILVNQTLLATEFKWGPVEGSHRDDCSVELDVQLGILSPREEKVINVSFLATREGEYSDLRLPCYIEGMPKPLYLGLFCEVKGLAVNYRISKTRYGEFTSDLHLDFGEVELGSTPKIYLHLRNESAIVAQHSMHMEKYNPKPPSPPEQKPRENNSRMVSQRRLMLGRTPNLADPMSKTPKKEAEDFCKSMLSQNQGLSVLSKSESNDTRLLPFGEEVIELTAYSDMWGEYSDNLICMIGDLKPVSIPVRIKVSGCPLQFQMTSSSKDLKPIVRFGTHVSGVAPVHRMMRVNNISPYDIRVDWEVFNVEENDDKLLDLTVAYGDAFPLKDSDGNEVIPPWNVPERLKRQPTDFIPNTPGTSAGSKRETPAPKQQLPIPTEEELMATRKKIISVFYRPHEGVSAENPYSVKNKQLVIPARGHANVHMSFTPFPTEQVPREMDCLGYALGFMSLYKGSLTESKVSRDHGMQVEPLRLDMTGHIKPALLTIECTDEEGMRYRSAMSDLLQADGKTSKESVRVASTMLSNQTETPLVFKLKTRAPFVLMDLDPTSNRMSATRTTETEFQTLRPQHNLLVKVGFQTSTDLLSRLNDDDSTASTTDDGVENTDNNTAETNGGRKIDINDHLQIEFNNTASQEVPLHATVALPQVELSKESLDFGTCLVGQRRELQLLITNKTSSHTYWFTMLDSCSDTCSPDTFLLEPSSGHLEAHITHVSNSKSLLRLFFTAKHAETYEGIFVFRGNLGEEPRKLYVRGQGSYDGKHEAVLNV